MSEIYQQQAPIGIRWVDAWNASLRPFACSLIIVLFIAVAAAFVWGVIGDTDFSQGDSMVRAAEVIWASLVGEAIQAVLGYLFGYRSAAKVRELVRR